ncbi:hypothetical protein CBL_20900 [Carabus blaptoides fortunei]
MPRKLAQTVIEGYSFTEYSFQKNHKTAAPPGHLGGPQLPPPPTGRWLSTPSNLKPSEDSYTVAPPGHLGEDSQTTAPPDHPGGLLQPPQPISGFQRHSNTLPRKFK